MPLFTTEITITFVDVHARIHQNLFFYFLINVIRLHFCVPADVEFAFNTRIEMQGLDQISADC